MWAPMGPKPKPPIDRWLPKVIKTNDHECWIWIGASDKTTGYGKFLFDGQTRPAHRFGYIYYRGPIPNGLVLDHRCRNRICVNPWHLEPETIGSNFMLGDISHRGAWQRARTHCPAGHPLSGENLWVNKHGGRHCKTCNRENMRKRRVRLREAV